MYKYIDIPPVKMEGFMKRMLMSIQGNMLFPVHNECI